MVNCTLGEYHIHEKGRSSDRDWPPGYVVSEKKNSQHRTGHKRSTPVTPHMRTTGRWTWVPENMGICGRSIIQVHLERIRCARGLLEPTEASRAIPTMQVSWEKRGKERGWREDWVGARRIFLPGQSSLPFLKDFTLMWAIFKSLIFYNIASALIFVLCFWLWGMWDLSTLTRDRTCIPCIGRWSLNHLAKSQRTLPDPVQFSPVA